jgi:branched-chain amino acid transport system ATP-binding protein
MTILECRNIVKHFGALNAVAGIGFRLEAGEILGIIGPNGAGKTTLFNCIMGLIRPDSGRVIFQGRDITGRKPYVIVRMGLAKTSQIAEPFKGLTVFENVLVAALHGGCLGRAEGKRRAEEVIHFIELSDHANTPAGSVSVSLGRRLELAKALAVKPKVVLLDENMAGLNYREIDETLELLHKIRDTGCSLVVIEHVMRAVMGISDRIIVLNHGAQIGEGTPAEIIRQDAVITAYFGEKAPECFFAEPE